MKGEVVIVLFALATAGAEFINIEAPHEHTKRQVNATQLEHGESGAFSKRSIFSHLFGGTEYYTCDFLPKISFYPENASPLPVYKCVLNNNEVLIATSSFHSATDARDFVTRATVVLNDQVLRTVYPGTFRPTSEVLFRGVNTGGSFSNPVSVNGLLDVSTPNLKSGWFSYFHPDRYSCEFLPSVNFYVEEYGQLPAYKCIRGSNEVLISTTSFRSAYNPYEFIHDVEVTLGDDVLKTYFPGSFIQVFTNQYKPVSGLDYSGAGVAINGLLPLTVY